MPTITEEQLSTIQANKKDLEQNFKDLIFHFEKESGVLVTDINFSRIEMEIRGDRRAVVSTDINIEISL